MLSLTIKSSDQSLDALLDDIVDGKKETQSFSVSLDNLDARTLMQVFELVQSAGGTTTLSAA